MSVKINPGALGTTAASTRTDAATTSGGAPSVSVSTNPSTGLGVRQNAAVVRDAIALIDAHADETHTNPLPDAPRNRIVFDNTLTNYKPVDTQGFSEQRPEIIAEFNFEPVYDDVSTDMSPVGDLLNIQITSRMLRAENVTNLLNELRANPETSIFISEFEKRVVKAESDAESELKFLFELDRCLANAKRSLSLKSNENFIKDDTASRDASVTNIDPIKDVIVNVLGFSEEGYKSFSDTKIIMQLLEDLFMIVKSYSPQLITRFDANRLNDKDPFTINKYTDSTAGALNDFDLSTLSSTSSDLRTILDRNGVESFNNSTRNIVGFDDRIKAFIAILSRELRVSAGLSNQTVRTTIINSFGLTQSQLDSNFFDYVIGRPGRTIFEQPSIGSQNSIAKLLLVNAGQNTVLPFESSFIKRAGTNVIPGQKYYVDSIIKGEKIFEVTPFVNFASSFGTATKSLATIIEGTFDVNVINSERLGLNGSYILDQILRSFKSSIDDIASRPLGPLSFFTDTQPGSTRDTFTPALLTAAADDPLLKHMLTLYVTVIGVKQAFEPGAQDGFFKTLVQSGDFNSGTGQTVEMNPLAGFDAEINRLLADVRANPMSRYGARQSSDDASRLLARTTETAQGNNVDVLSSAIVARLLDVEASSNPPRNTQPGNEAYDNVSEFRIYDKLSSFGSNDQSFLLKAIVELINKLDLSARAASPTNEKYVKEGVTRFNNLGLHTVIRMIVDIYVSFFKAFPVATFAGATTAVSLGSGGKEISIRRNDELTGELKEALRQLCQTDSLRPTGFSNVLFLNDQTNDKAARVRSIVDRFNAIDDAFEREDIVIKKIVNILLAIGNGVSYSSSDVARFFNAGGPNAAYLNALSAQNDINAKLAALDSAQIALSRNLLFEYKSNVASPFIQGTIVDGNVASSLFSMLRSPEFTAPASTNVKIISVGLPTGFSESLREKSSAFIGGTDFKEFSRRAGLANDVIRVHVYMKDLLFNDIVFKPLSFVFQTGRFVASPDFASTAGLQSFNDIIDETTTRVLSPDSSKFDLESLNEGTLASGESYKGVVTEADRQQLAKNHVKSFLLSIYLGLLTGIEFTEDGFYVGDAVADLRVDPESLTIFQRLIETRVSSLAGRKITLADLAAQNENVKNILQRLTDEGMLQGVIDPLGDVLPDLDKATNVELSEDLMNFMKVFSTKSVLVGAGARKIRALSPKLFERIFNIAVDPDAFEIDNDLTLTTESGKSFLSSQLANRLISRIDENDPRRLRMNQSIRRQLGNISLQQFFVTVEQLPSLDDQRLSLTTLISGNTSDRPRNIVENVSLGGMSAKQDTYESTPSTSDAVDWSRIV